jgi:hypothetical protein
LPEFDELAESTVHCWAAGLKLLSKNLFTPTEDPKRPFSIFPSAEPMLRLLLQDNDIEPDRT